MIAGARTEILRDISELTNQRHEKEGNTIFHLEPNVKNSPGGLRDYPRGLLGQPLLSRASAMASSVRPEKLWPPNVREEMEQGLRFPGRRALLPALSPGARRQCTLPTNCRLRRPPRGIGVEPGRAIEPADWMRIYFRHARAIYGLATQILDETAPTRQSVFGRFEGWRARRAHPEFYVVGGRVDPATGPDALQNLDRILRLIRVHGPGGLQTQPGNGGSGARASCRRLRDSVESMPNLWDHFRGISDRRPFAPDALRAMHAAGVLVLLFPEFACIDSLVIRDFYHHYTVDAHSFMAIENIHRLAPGRRQAGSSRSRRSSPRSRSPNCCSCRRCSMTSAKECLCDDHVVGKPRGAREGIRAAGPERPRMPRPFAS